VGLKYYKIQSSGTNVLVKHRLAVSRATFYFPDVQAAGTIKTSANPTPSPPATTPTPVQPTLPPRGAELSQTELGGGSRSGGGRGERSRVGGWRHPSITEVNVIFSIKDMCNEVRADMLNFLLEMQRTMKNEMHLFLKVTLYGCGCGCGCDCGCGCRCIY
jgi:hypothetical protein